jgi:hypothetical protein
MMRASQNRIDHVITDYQGKELLDKILDLENRYIVIDNEKIFDNSDYADCIHYSHKMCRPTPEIEKECNVCEKYFSIEKLNFKEAK